MDIRLNGSAVSSIDNILNDIEAVLRNYGVTNIVKQKSIEQLLHELKVEVRPWSPVSESILSATFFGQKVFQGYRIMIHERILRHPKEDYKKVLLKSCILHELAHILLNDPAYYYFKSDDPYVAVYSNIAKAFGQWAKNPHSGQPIETISELLSICLAIQPKVRFINDLYKSAFDFRMLSHKYMTPLDCCIKWVVLTFRQFPFYYMKYNIATNTVEDVYTLREGPYETFPWKLDVSLFANNRTAASECFKTKKDSEGSITDPKGISFYCKAYYVEADRYMRKEEKIIVVGYPQGIFDMVMAFAQ